MQAIILAIALGQPTLPAVEMPTLPPISRAKRTASNGPVAQAGPAISAELERISRRYPKSKQHTDARGVVWRKSDGKWTKHYQSVLTGARPNRDHAAYLPQAGRADQTSYAAPRSARLFRPTATRKSLDVSRLGLGVTFSANARACAT